MEFLAYENVHAVIVYWRRSTGHDVLSCADDVAGETDVIVLRALRRRAASSSPTTRTSVSSSCTAAL